MDLYDTCDTLTSIVPTPFLSGGLVAPGSGAFVGNGVFLGNDNSFCNLFATGQSFSGRLRLAVQCADADVSGQYTDPTSGMSALPTAFQSGGILWLNSGLDGGVFGPVVSGQNMISGFFAAAGFQRPGTFARVIALAEGTAQFAGPLTAGFVSQRRTTGSGPGYTLSPSSGTINV